MELRLLKVFCAVAESGSLVAAAGKVHLTPSAVSHSLKSLETDLGCRLFERVGRRMALNHAGEQLLAQIQQPIAALDRAAEGIKRLDKWGQARLRIGAPDAACEHLVPAVLQELRKHHRSMEVHLECANTPRLIELLHANKVDLALGLTPGNPTGLALRPMFRDELLFAFAPAHAWADGRPISRDDIHSQPLIAGPHSSLTALLVEEHFRRLKVPVTVAMEVASTAATVQFLKLNLGVAILAPWTVDRELVQRKVKMRPLGPKTLYRRWSILSLASRRMTLVEETFCRLCRNQAAGLRLDRSDLPSAK